MSTTLRTSKLLEICPPSISYDQKIQAASAAFDNQMYEIIDDTGQVVMIPNILGLTDENLVNILAWQFHVDFYDTSKPLDFRKQLVQLSIQWHKTKGSVALVQSVLDMYWPQGATIEEWYNYKSPLPPNYPADGWHERYLFRISVDGAVIPPTQEATALALVNLYKPISRWCEGIIYPLVSSCDIGWAGAALVFVIIESEAPAYP